MMALAAGTTGALSGCASPMAQPGGAEQPSMASVGPGPAVTHKASHLRISTDASGHRLGLIQTAQPDLPVVPGGPPSHITHLDGSGKNSRVAGGNLTLRLPRNRA